MQSLSPPLQAGTQLCDSFGRNWVEWVWKTTNSSRSFGLESRLSGKVDQWIKRREEDEASQTYPCLW